MKHFSLAKASLTAAYAVAALAPANIAHATSGDGYSNGVLAVFGPLFILFVLAVAAIAIGLFVLWVVMLVDALQRKNWQDDTQKNVWIIVLVLSFFAGFSWVAAIVYYFAVKRQLDSSTATVKGKAKK
jgi:H+/Cl- antiporter ClcA